MLAVLMRLSIEGSSRHINSRAAREDLLGVDEVELIEIGLGRQKVNASSPSPRWGSSPRRTMLDACRKLLDALAHDSAS